MGERRLGNYSSCCRLCLTENCSSLLSVFDDASGNLGLVQKISTFVGIEITANDKLSTLICDQCILKINNWSDFKETCSENQNKLEVWLNNWNTSEVLGNVQIKDEPFDSNEYAREPEVIIEDESAVPIKMEPMEIQAETVMEAEFDEYPPNLTLPDGSYAEKDSNCEQVDSSDYLSNSDYITLANDVDDSSFGLSDKTNRNCTICNKLFSTPGNRRKHEKTIHGLSDKALDSYGPLKASFDSYNVNRKPLSGTVNVAVAKSNSLAPLNNETSQESLTPPTAITDNQTEKSEDKTKNDDIQEDEKEAEAESKPNSDVTPDSSEDMEDKDKTVETEQVEKVVTDAEKQKIRFAAGLKLQQRTATPNQQDKLSKIEWSYIEKCKAMITMYDTLVCACHNLPYKNMKRLFAHLRSIRIWFPIYTCYNCMITFTDRSTNMRHYVKCPRKRLEHLMRLSELRENDELKTRLYQNFRCTRCKFLFTFYEDFCEHVDTVHVHGEAPYNCSCGKTFEAVDEFKEHGYKSCLLEFYCDMCFVISSTLEEFVAHCVEMHDNSEGFTLLQEDNYTPRKVAHTRHSTHLQLQECKEESQKVPDLSYFAGDKQKPTSCSVCGRVYSNYHNMLRHYRVHDETEKAIQCPECPEKFRLNTHLKEHIEAEHSDFNKKYIFACQEPECGEIFKSMRDWTKHKEAHLKKCLECGKQFEVQEELDQHRSVHLNLKLYRDSKTQKYKSEAITPSITLSCELCNITFLTKDDLEEHQMIHDDEMPMLEMENGGEKEEEVDVKPDISKKYSCLLCKIVYKGYGGLWEHNRRKHPGRSISRDFPRQCLQCDKIIYHSRAWEMHKNMHTAMLQQHAQKTNHNSHPRAAKHRTSSYDVDDADESYHTCKRCFKVFSSKYNLKNHMKSHGINITSTTSKYGKNMKHSNTVWCDICHQPCDGFEDLEEHKKEHEMEHMPQLSDEVELIDRKKMIRSICDICNINFHTEAVLRKHKQDHAAELLNSPMSERQNYVYCKYCKIPFTTVDLLNEHMTIEHDEYIKNKANAPKQPKYQFTCNFCPKLFDTAGALCSHQGWHKRSKIQRHYNLQNKLFKKYMHNIPKKEVKEEPEPEIFRCNTCRATFHTDTSLQIHILEKHRNINATLLSPKCSQCDIDFKSTEEYEKHKRLHTMVQIKKAKPNSCPHCPAAFTRSDTLQAHMKQFHKSHVKKTLTCQYCNRNFEKQNALTIHLKKHARENFAPTVYVQPPPKMYNCSICHKGFLEAKDLRKHTISQHPF